jgi:hypothetical protein
MPVMGGSQNSRLVFATVHDQSAQPVLSKIYAACASRFHGRNPASREKSPIVLQGRSRHAESQNEIKAFRVLAATARADQWQEQPFLMEFHRGDWRLSVSSPILEPGTWPCLVAGIRERSTVRRIEMQAPRPLTLRSRLGS